MSDLKNDLAQFVKSLGAYDMRIADPAGFENAMSGCHPHDVWEKCNSVVVFGIYVGFDYYRSIQVENKTFGDNRIMHILRDWIQFKVSEFLQQKRHNSMIPTGLFNREKLIHRMSLKLAAYEAGLGVYGRCGIIITPEHGPRVNFGAVLTDARLEPDEKLANFNPCLNCRLCIDSCPPKAIWEKPNPPTGHNRDKCVNFVQKLREKLGDKQFLCGYCYNFCPVGKTDKLGFTLSKYKTLLDLSARKREHLINEVLVQKRK